MRHLLIAGVLVLVSTVESSAQVQLETPAAPINVVFREVVQFEDAITFMARAAGVTIEFDATVTDEIRRAPIADQPIRFVNVTFEQALTMLTSTNGLVYTIIGPKAVRISKKA